TLVSLIPRLYEADSGTVSVGGRPVDAYTMEHLRDAVSVVLQKNTLFSGTIRENLLWGNPHAADEELWAACRAACASEFLERMPEGLDTDLGQGGVNVSGGQKQRLCIARAILKKPKVLILDDSTSAVDTATDAKIRAAFASELKDTTKFIIAQRVASVREADVILVMDGGKIVAQGAHEELMQTCEIYREVFQSQQEGASMDG
ncbi:MAG: ABC transporter ATP-binding protein, partial [Oscillibacter sp.]|nr:ABC transporter ATP-binding protein [Oscillibacter sp.]